MGKKTRSELTDELLMHSIELEERLNKATLIALHYNPITYEFKSIVDHLDEVYAYLKSEELIDENFPYTKVKDYFSKKLQKDKSKL